MLTFPHHWHDSPGPLSSFNCCIFLYFSINHKCDAVSRIACKTHVISNVKCTFQGRHVIIIFWWMKLKTSWGYTPKKCHFWWIYWSRFWHVKWCLNQILEMVLRGLTAWRPWCSCGDSWWGTPSTAAAQLSAAVLSLWLWWLSLSLDSNIVSASVFSENINNVSDWSQ